MIMKKVAIALCVMLVVALFSLNGFAASKGVIGISVLTMQNPFFKVIADNVKAEAEKNGYSVVVVSGELDPGTQNNQVNDFITQKVSAIILNPVDSKAIGTAI